MFLLNTVMSLGWCSSATTWQWENGLRWARTAALNNRHTMISSPSTPALKYLSAYPDDVKQQVGQLLADNQLGERLLRKYRETRSESVV